MVCFNLNAVLMCCVFSFSPFIVTGEMKSLGLCKLPKKDFDPMDFAQEGIKGVRGDIGEQGPKGIKGETGDSPKGLKGGIGVKGPIGPRGKEGFPGVNGAKGMQGDKGKTGIPGSMGRPGTPGKNGICPCAYAKMMKPAIPKLLKNLGEEVCKNVQSIGTENEVTREIGSTLVDKPVICEPREGLNTLTCIPRKTNASSVKEHTFTNISNGFWLSSEGVTLEDIYDLDHDFIQWFLKKSNSVFQTIRYHCYNSVPFSLTNVNKSILLLGWNEKTIGPIPTLKNPNFYSVPFETDFCSKTKDKWSYTDIIIVSDNNQRLPIIDFYIRDTNNEVTQMFKIEHLKLCFD